MLGSPTPTNTLKIHLSTCVTTCTEHFLKTDERPQYYERARKINGQQYLYDKKAFKNMSSKMRIFCKKHKIWFDY